MANLIIKSSADDLVLQGSDTSPAITVAAAGTTTFAENTTLSGTGNNLGTVTAGTLGSAVTGGAGLQGITHASQWRMITTFAGNAQPIASALEEVDSYAFGVLGASMTESSGTFTFPVTGYWYVTYKVRTVGDSGTASNRMYARIYTSTNSGVNFYDSSVAENWVVGNSYQTCFTDYIMDVSSTSTHKVQFWITQGHSSHQVHGDTLYNATSMTFIRLGAT